MKYCQVSRTISRAVYSLLNTSNVHSKLIEFQLRAKLVRRKEEARHVSRDGFSESPLCSITRKQLVSVRTCV